MRVYRRIVCALVCVCLLAATLNGCTLFFNEPEVEPTIDWDTAPIEQPVEQTGYTYYFDQLSLREQHAYQMILREIESFPTEVEIPLLTREQLKSVYLALSYDNPMLFLFSKNCRIETRGGKHYFSCEYRFDKETYTQMRAQVQTRLDAFIQSVNTALSDFEKQVLVHDWVVKNCTYNNEAIEMESTPYSAIVDGKASCEGYARAAKLALDALGVPCMLVSGKAENEQGAEQNHMWNLVQIEGKFYHMDLTWDDPISQKGEEDERYTFLNLTDEDILKSHYDFDVAHTCDSMDANYYVKTGVYFTAYNKATRTAIATALKQRIAKGEGNVEIRFASKAAYEQALEGLFRQEHIFRILSTATLGSSKYSNEDVRYVQNDLYQVVNILLLEK